MLLLPSRESERRWSPSPSPSPSPLLGGANCRHYYLTLLQVAPASGRRRAPLFCSCVQWGVCVSQGSQPAPSGKVKRETARSLERVKECFARGHGCSLPHAWDEKRDGLPGHSLIVIVCHHREQNICTQETRKKSPQWKKNNAHTNQVHLQAALFPAKTSF